MGTKMRLDTAGTDNWLCGALTISRMGTSVHFAVHSWVVSPTAAEVERAVATKYVVSFKTGMELNAATVSEPSMTLSGNKGETHSVKLEGVFKMGATTVIPIWATDVGKVTQL